MSTPDPTPPPLSDPAPPARPGRAADTTPTMLVLAFAFALVVLISLGLLLRRHGPGHMGDGMLVGGGVTLVLFVVAAWRTRRHPASSLTAERALTGAGDERDRAVLQASAAVVGVAALPMTATAAVALALGSPVEVVVALLLWAELALAVVSLVVVGRRS